MTAKKTKHARAGASATRHHARKTVRRAAATASTAGATVASAGQDALQAAAGFSELIAAASENTLAANPLIGIQRSDIAAAARALLGLLRASPQRATLHFAHFLGELSRVIRGDSQLAPDPKDRRFADPAWQSNGLYRRELQTYLAMQKELSEFIERSPDSPRDKGRAQFFASLVTDALAPSNWLLGNPAAVRKILDTGGANLVSGLKNLVHDVRYNHMLPSQVDASAFRVGENLATSPGQVVHRSAMFELLQYAPATARVHARPLLMAPPQVNKFYAVDLSAEKSLVRWTTESGVQFFIVSWRNPTAHERDWGLEQYVLALDEAVDVVRDISGSADVNMWGSCSGGMTLAAYLGYLAAGGEPKVANTMWAVCVLNMTQAMEGTTLGLFNSPAAIRAAKARSGRKGVIEGAEMAARFAWLRPNDLIWNYWVNNYLLGNQPPAFDILAWNADTTRLPAQFHSDLLDLIEQNPFVNPGALQVAGRPVDLTQVRAGAFVIGGITDHITPWKGCYGTARLFGADTTFVLANAGHLQSLINPPGSPKAFYFTAPASAADPEEWARSAQRHEGSWWPFWRAWIKARSGAEIEAPTTLGSAEHPPLTAAPGEYVHER
jgi:polyhydroxyalkanoate synthase subunit PhaC